VTETPNPNIVDTDTLTGEMHPIRRCVLAIGSNLGERLANLQGAVNTLADTPEVWVTAVSPVYETAPVDAPDESGDFLNAVVLASSEGHDRKDFVVVHEERLGLDTTIPGQTLEQLIRADMTYIEKPKGGAVFSVGSICYCGALPAKGFDNDVSRLTFNVLNRFGELNRTWPL